MSSFGNYWQFSIKKESLNSDGQSFRQYQQNQQLPLNSDGQQIQQ
jgi:hypothetical protein